MTHALKTWPEYFKAIADETKNFEIRKEDRPFKVGDTLLIQEYVIGTKGTGYTGKEEWRMITFILRDAPGFGLMDGYVIMGLRSISRNQDY